MRPLRIEDWLIEIALVSVWFIERDSISMELSLIYDAISIFNYNIIIEDKFTFLQNFQKLTGF